MPKKLFKFLVSVSLVLAGVFLLVKPVWGISASGPWSAGEGGGGTVSIDFPAAGGSVNGSFSGSASYGVRYGGSFSGDFTGGWDGKFSGRFSGWFKVPNIQGEIITKNVGGPWTGSLSPSGTITATFTNTVPGGVDGRATVNFSPETFTEEYGMSYEEYLNRPEPSEEPEWQAKVEGWISGKVVALVDGEEVEVDEDFILKPGMRIKTIGEDSEVHFTLDEGGVIMLRGDQSWIEVFPAGSVDKEERQKIFGEQEMDPYKDMLVMGPGTMVVKYQSGEKKGHWIPDSDQKEVSGDHGKYVILSSVPYGGLTYRNKEDLEKDPTFMGGNYYVAALKDYGGRPPPLYVPKEEEKERSFWKLFFSNDSEVKYDYDGQKLNLEVVEGEVGVYRTDFNGQVEKLSSVKTGESLDIDLDDFLTSDGEEGVVEKQMSWWRRLIFWFKNLFSKDK